MLRTFNEDLTGVPNFFAPILNCNNQKTVSGFRFPEFLLREIYDKTIPGLLNVHVSEDQTEIICDIAFRCWGNEETKIVSFIRQKCLLQVLSPIRDDAFNMKNETLGIHGTSPTNDLKIDESGGLIPNEKFGESYASTSLLGTDELFYNLRFGKDAVINPEEISNLLKSLDRNELRGIIMSIKIVLNTTQNRRQKQNYSDSLSRYFNECKMIILRIHKVSLKLLEEIPCGITAHVTARKEIIDAQNKIDSSEPAITVESFRSGPSFAIVMKNQFLEDSREYENRNIANNKFLGDCIGKFTATVLTDPRPFIQAKKEAEDVDSLLKRLFVLFELKNPYLYLTRLDVDNILPPMLRTKRQRSR